MSYVEFFELLPHVLKNDELKLEQLRTWPLFRSVRQQQHYMIYAGGTGDGNVGRQEIKQ
jgi:hypothetical protein